MSRSREEEVFSDAIGCICEDEIATIVLRPLCDPGTKPLNLNVAIRRNHPWADWAIWQRGRPHIVAVRGRIKWQKPQESNFSKNGFRAALNTSFNGQGDRLRLNAVNSVKKSLKIAVDGPIECIWLAVAVDIDGTYDAYWGTATEMRQITRADEDEQPGLAVPMRAADIVRYTRENRKLADRQPHPFPWHMGGHWACKAREHWLRLEAVSDYAGRIRDAIKAAAIEILRERRPQATPAEPRRDPPAPRTAPADGRHSSAAGGTKSARMAHRIRQGDLPWECACLLRVLASEPVKAWSMPEIAKAMQAQPSEDGRPYRNDRYNEAAAALEIAGFVRNFSLGHSLLRQITELGIEFCNLDGPHGPTARAGDRPLRSLRGSKRTLPAME